MAEEFGTINVKRGDRAQEIELLRQHYNLHRDTLVRMVPDAPTQHLANEYQRLVADIDASIRKLSELHDSGVSESPRTAPANRPLVSPEPVAERPITSYTIPSNTPSNNSSRVLLMLVIFVAILGVIGYLIWRASSDRKAAKTEVIEQPLQATSSDAAPVAATAPVPAKPSIKIAPEVADYGVIRKGTRAVRQFEVTNTTTTPLTLVVARSACRCLYYEYNTKAKLAAKSKEVLTVTVDGARAKAGALEEKIAVTSKDDPGVNGTIGVRAVIR